MRPFLVLCGTVLIAVSAFAQIPVHPGYYPWWGYDPSIPRLTTPMASFETISPNPVGATNATTGLVAGATNSTLSQIQGSTSSNYTAAVWYQGGAPLVTPEVNLWPEPIGHEMHGMRHAMGEEGMYEHSGRKEAPNEKQWVYFSGPEHTANVAAASAGKGSRQAGHKYSNDDVTRQNDNNGKVHYDGKTEKIQ